MRSSHSSKPSVDRFGLPLSRDEAAPIASNAANSIGELSNNRSMAIVDHTSPILSYGASFPSPLSTSAFSTTPPSVNMLSARSVSRKISGQYSVGKVTSNWKIAPESFTCKPATYLLDPQSRIVMKSNASEIAARISDCLRRRSISASFSGVKAKATCVTSDGVEFRIRLFAGKEKFKGGVIVEVQRRSGWSTSYHQDCLALLESAECNIIGDCVIIEELVSPDNVMSNYSVEVKNLCLSKLLLLSDSVETKLLGIESLCSLTDVLKCGHETALNTAEALFLDSNNVHIQDILRVLVLQNKMNCNSISEFSLKRARLMSLKTIMNSCIVLLKTKKLKQALLLNTWIEHYLISCLMNDLKNISDPHTATVAARCLNAITSASVVATNTAIELGALQILESAHTAGTQSHAGLAHETKKFPSHIHSI